MFLRAHYCCFSSPVFALWKLTSLSSLVYFSCSSSLHLSSLAKALISSLNGKFTLSFRTQKLSVMITVKITIALGYIVLLSDISSLVKKSTVTTVAYRIKLGCHTLAFRALPSGTSLFQPHLSLFPSINPLLDLRWRFLHARYSSLHFWAWLSYCWIYSPLWISSFLTRILDTFSRPSSNLLSSLVFPDLPSSLWSVLIAYNNGFWALLHFIFSTE